ncbi:ATP-binding domain-containing protein [bacterium BD-1]|nr:ATP-binding domain-containing protein [Ottowia caeni]
MQIFPKESSVRGDPNARLVIEHLKSREDALGLESAILFHNFPLFREDEKLLVADVVLISPNHGVLLIGAPSQITAKTRDQLDGAFSQVYSRLVRYPRLRSGRAKLLMHVDACIWLAEGAPADGVVVGLPALEGFLSSQKMESPIAGDVFDELISVIDGSKALIKPKERKTEGFGDATKVAVIARVEDEIRRFDRDQRVAYMTEIGGLQRIQGLAGSGKTVVLALKAALTAVREPEARIAVTFYTKSLYQHIKQLITRFFRMHEDRDPDWDRIQVLHAWGGATADGLYYQTARRFGHEALNYPQANALSPGRPFAFACARLLADSGVASTFDYVFVDEAQDFPPEFMKLALRLAKDQKLVIAYDVFQTIFDVETPTAASLFGTNGEADPLVEFDEEIVLHKCYRNPREILVCAHAIGFGIYGQKIVQMLESHAHWEDFGYEVAGELTPRQRIEVTRPRENSPSSISDTHTLDQIISCSVFQAPREEVAFVVARIQADIGSEGVTPEDILVICADDRNAGVYLDAISRSLSAVGIRVNNLHRQQYGIPDFQQEGAVTLSTVYKAKGNEAYSVYIVGIDALFYHPSPRSRNRAFTAMTRAKGWLTVSGVGVAALRFEEELKRAKENFPSLRFIYPSEEDILIMKRDLVQLDPSDVDEQISELGQGMDPEDFEKILRKKIRDIQSLKRSKKRIK